MTDTPETDAAARYMGIADEWVPRCTSEKLERERDGAIRSCHIWQKGHSDIVAERDRLLKNLNVLAYWRDISECDCSNPLPNGGCLRCDLNKLFNATNQMTDEQINKAIAKTCGWVQSKSPEWYQWWHKKGSRNYQIYCPNYAGCLNAMHEAEITLMYSDPHAYGCYSCDLYEQYGNTVHLSAAQRAEAFLKTIGKWEETK